MESGGAAVTVPDADILAAIPEAGARRRGLCGAGGGLRLGRAEKPPGRGW